MTTSTFSENDLLESFAGFPEPLRARISDSLTRLPWHHYPRLSEKLRTRVAAHYRVGPRNVLTTRGCTEALATAVEWAARAATPAGSAVIAIPTPSWPGFTRLADRAGLPWSHYAVGEQPPDGAIPIICTPNNPTGHHVSEHDLARLRARTSAVVVDCTYDESSEAPILPVAHRLIDDGALFCVNLGKSTGLTGARLGLLIAAEDVVAAVESTMDAFRLDVFQLATLDVLFSADGLHAWQELVRATRSATTRCRELLTALMPCGVIGPAIGRVVYGRYTDHCADHLAAVVAATGAAVYPVERRFRVRTDERNVEALARIVPGEVCR